MTIRFGAVLKIATRIFRYLKSIFRMLFIDHPARTASLAILIVVIWTNLGLKFWKDPGRLLIWDVKVYYVYLPATFIYHDLSLKFVEERK
jgi:hypothetical protein